MLSIVLPLFDSLEPQLNRSVYAHQCQHKLIHRYII